jgi:hypothetical protein
MTYLERTLATLSEAIAAATAGGHAPQLASLVRRRDVIRAALAAPEQACHITPGPGSAYEVVARPPRAQPRGSPVAILAKPGVQG